MTPRKPSEHECNHHHDHDPEFSHYPHEVALDITKPYMSIKEALTLVALASSLVFGGTLAINSYETRLEKTSEGLYRLEQEVKNMKSDIKSIDHSLTNTAAGVKRIESLIDSANTKKSRINKPTEDS